MSGKTDYFCFIFSFFIFPVLIQSAALPNLSKQSDSKCGYESCPKTDPNKLNVHLVPHTHDDVGWLKTVDQYFYGSNTSIQRAGVQYIIDTAIEALKRDPQRKFIYVETAFLWKWWLNQNDAKKAEVRALIDEGRLEIIGGAWSMNDEATTHYHSIVDQFTWGFRRLNDTFGECARPKIGWQIDPFGHSREQASLFAQFGFDGMFFGRLDYQDKTTRLTNKTAEFLWRASSSLGKKADLFSIALYNNYSPPPGFCFDVLCSDDPLIDDPESPDNNIAVKIKIFYDYVQKQANYYRTSNLILTMGGDFTYQQSEMYFTNLDKLIRHTNRMYGSQVNVFYSTPSCYIKSLNEANKSWPTKTDDFFPYSSDPHAFWTGYFTSRPTLKYFERMGNNFLQIAKQLSVSSMLMDSKELINFRETMGVMQHHDAVTGTEKQHVAEDYARLLHQHMTQGAAIVSNAMEKMSKKKNISKEEEVDLKYYSCFLLNISSCEFSEGSSNFVVTLYNPTSHALSPFVRIPVLGLNYTVKDFVGAEIQTQMVPIPRFVSSMPGKKSTAMRELVFRAIEVPALGYRSFYISETDSGSSVQEVDRPATVSSIGGNWYNISVNDNGNVLIKWKKIDLEVTQSFHYYQGMKGNNSQFINRASGAYIFRPNQTSLHIQFNGSYSFYVGPLVQELHLKVNDFVSEIVRVYHEERKIELDWVVGPIPINDSIGKEVIIKYESNLKSKNTFYTDSNGREMLMRVRNYRPTWNLSLEEPVAGNYYPVTSKIFLEDKERKMRLTILNDRAQGGSSMADGELEVMLHRRLLNDDAFGVGEALNESAFGTGLVAKGTHYLVGGKLDDLVSMAMMEKYLAVELALRPWPLLTPINMSFDQWHNTHLTQHIGLRKPLPANLQILTLEPWKDNMILLRLEHLFEIGEDSELSQPVEINLVDLFMNFDIIAVRETSLGGNQWIENMKRLKWQAESNEIEEEVENFSELTKSEDDIINVVMKPMEIRTFIITEYKFRLKEEMK
ncbi:lysosomal alpha-mannosidase isoform X1 [Chelonus insularis]|uniref:lysosomal alpha-mannosidase isoform X1 n=1 Tax=Chelonus insularis TaxID=460826 RepID=UPI001589B1F0|nr:lysosomal alpha-mannosidase isoform X1 [Chelonus insularis]